MNIDQDNKFVWLDGKIIELQEATVSVLTHSLHYSGAVFEGEKAYNGKVFKLEEHTERLLYSARNLRLEVPYTAQEIMEAHYQLIKHNKISNAYIRPFIFRTSETLSLAGSALTAHLLIATVIATKKSPKPFKLNLSSWRKPAPNVVDPQIKSSGHYNMSIVIQLEAKDAGYNDSLILDWRGYVAETTTTNIFFVRDGILITPIADAFLNGITRQTFIQLAQELGIEVKEKHIEPEEIENFEECFLTGTAIEMKEVESINLDGQEIKFHNSNITPQLKEAFYNLVNNLQATV